MMFSWFVWFRGFVNTWSLIINTFRVFNVTEKNEGQPWKFSFVSIFQPVNKMNLLVENEDFENGEIEQRSRIILS